jgi:outer membrane protein, multidrug efflux system
MKTMTRPRRLAALGSTAALLAACASPGGPHAGGADTPPVAAPAWQAALPAETNATNAQRWWEGFADPALLRLQAAALQASPGVSAAKSRIEQARTGLVQAQARRQPTLDAAAVAREARDAPSAPRVGSLSLGVQAAWELDLFGGNAAAAGAAGARLQAAQAQAEGARVALLADVAAAYAGLRACEAQLQPTRADATSRAETARLTELSARAGVQAPATAALARAGAAQSNALLNAQQAGCDALRKALVALTALPEPQLRELLTNGAATLPKAPALTVASLPADLLAQRPDVFAAGREVAASAAEIEQARAANWPRLGLAGSIGAVRVQTSGAGSDSGSSFAIGPVQLSLPLFDAGVRRAQSAAAQARYADAVVQYQASLRQAVREVEEALLTLQSSAAREGDVRTAAEGFEANLKAAEARFRGGLGSLFELEDARRTALAAQSAWIELQRERLLAWVNLYRALGGGFDADQLGSPIAEAKK